jgi:hypothetical protein
MATEYGPASGVRYIIHRKGTPQFRNDGGKLVAAGEWWHRSGPLSHDGGGWGCKALATPYRDPRRVTLPDGGEWVAMLVNVPAVTDTAAGDNWGSYLGAVES